jgi:hypothetical protein
MLLNPLLERRAKAVGGLKAACNFGAQNQAHRKYGEARARMNPKRTHRTQEVLCDRTASPWDIPERRPWHIDRRKALQRYSGQRAIRRQTERRPLSRQTHRLFQCLVQLLS